MCNDILPLIVASVQKDDVNSWVDCEYRKITGLALVYMTDEMSSILSEVAFLQQVSVALLFRQACPLHMQPVLALEGTRLFAVVVELVPWPPGAEPRTASSLLQYPHPGYCYGLPFSGQL